MELLKPYLELKVEEILKTYKEVNMKYRRNIGHTNINDDQYELVDVTDVVRDIFAKIDQLRKQRRIF